MPADAPKFALLHVTGIELIAPKMMRVRFGGDDLAAFRSVSPDQQAKFFFAKPGQGAPVVPPMPEDGNVMTWFQAYRSMPEARRPWMRSYSIRAHHAGSGEIDVDFVLHEHPGEPAGPATSWAKSASVGDRVGMLGPARSHFVTPGAYDWRLLVGDESALPAIAALLDADSAVPTLAYIEVADAAEEQPLTGADVHWLHRDGLPAGRSELLVEAVRAAEFPPGTPFAWLAGESSAVRALRRHLVNDRGVNRKQIAFSGYWRLHLTQDDDPTTEDVAERAEIMAELGGA
ncbi:siderophore-interacting protein [Pseudonocardia spinosispora]|uniref:siderophore-interacting protein n=1 Tax=Pseudonocardia spinosispora TaxID=103441 RepID=UPI0004124704|nr:siderophore-interacting protein [Pseudonocardia spinosispora]